MDIYLYIQSYNENSGGVIVMHRLCHVINSIPGYRAYLIPRRIYFHKNILQKTLEEIKIKFCKYYTHPSWDTPIYKKKKVPDDSVIIYPEIVKGNPVQAKNVVRWLLHQPGYLSREIDYSDGELYFKFNTAINDFMFSGSTTSENHLKVIYYPIDIYHEDKFIEKDIDVCYMIRKGHYKRPVHNDNAICVDGLSHREIAAIFKRSKRFISYDDYTAYSIFAALCGCESVVIPDGITSIDQWYPNITDRYGIAYGLEKEQLEWANTTRYKVKKHIEAEHQKVVERVKISLSEMKSYFGL